MFRVVSMQNKWYAIEIESVEDDAENMQDFAESNDIVIVVDSLDMLGGLGIQEDEVKIVT